MNRYPVRDYNFRCREKAPRLFDILIDEDGEAKIETKHEKESHRISLKEAFRQAGKRIEYIIKD